MPRFSYSALILCLFFSACGTGFTPNRTTTQAAINPVKISAAEAIQKAKNSGKTSGWQIAMLSNTGVTSAATSNEIDSPEAGLMNPDGKAGQWVIEYFKDNPKSVSEGGRTGKSYPFLRLIVTANSVSQLPSDDITVPTKLVDLKQQYISALDTARQTAISGTKSKFDVMSVESSVKSDGNTSWEFRFYDTNAGEVTDNITVSGDGKRKLG